MTLLWLCVKAALIVACGFWVLRRVALRVIGDRALWRIVLASYALHVSMALGFYACSWWHWPVLTSLQLGKGFWAFAIDGRAYHYFGALVVDAWKHGIELPKPEIAVEYIAVIAGIYRLFRQAHPLLPILINSVMATATACFAYRIAGRLTGEDRADRAVPRRAALISAALVAFWPSSFMWSSLLLKDTLSWLLIFSVLWLIVSAVTASEAMRQTGSSRRHWLLRGVLLGCAVIMLTRLRFYVGSAVLWSGVLVLVPAAGYALARRRMDQALGYLGVAAIVVGSTLFSRTLDVHTLLSPAHTERGHFSLGVQSLRDGKFQAAEDEFARTLTLDRAYTSAYAGLAAAKMHEGKLRDALEIYAVYVQREHDPARRAAVQKVRSRIFLNQGDLVFARGTWREAVVCYEQAIRLDPTLLAGYLGLARTWTQQQQFDAALAGLDQAGVAVKTENDRREVDAARQQTLAAQERAIRLLAASLAPVATPVSPAPVRSVVEPPPEDPSATRRRKQSREEELASLALSVFSTPQDVDRPSGLSHQRLESLTQSLTNMNDQVAATMSETQPAALGSSREAFVVTGGHSLMDAWAEISSPRKLLAYLPRAMAIGFFAPFPRQWFDLHGSTGIMRLFGGLEMAIFYLLWPAVLLGVWRIRTPCPVASLAVLAFIVILMVPISLVVANLGTLFRLRLQCLLPLLVVAAAGMPTGWLRLFGIERDAASRRPAAATDGPSGGAERIPDMAASTTTRLAPNRF